MFTKARRTLVWWNVGVMIFLAGLIVLAMYFSISHNIEQEITRDLSDDATALLKSTRFIPLAAGVAPATTLSSKEKHEDREDKYKNGKLETDKNIRSTLSTSFYFLIDAKGTVVENPSQIGTSGLPDLSGLDQVLKGETVVRDLTIENNTRLRLYSVPVRLEGEQVVGMVQVAKNLASYQNQLTSVLATTGIVATFGVLLAIGLAMLLTRRALIPVKKSMERQREFVADASHELRTPLTLIKANTEVLLRSKKKTIEQSAEYLEDIRQETDYLTRLVSDMLTLARSDMGNLEHHAKPVEIQRVAREVAESMQPIAQAKKLVLKYDETHGTGETWLPGDPQRLRQLLIILLDNAIKYTPAGEVTLSVAAGHGQTVVIKVSDTGIGIPQDQQAAIFERFFRVSKARTHSEGSYGLGLAIAQWITQVHGGKIEVNSVVDKGSTFTITLPARVPGKNKSPITEFYRVAKS